MLPTEICRRCGKTRQQHRRFTLDPSAAPMCYATNRNATFIKKENPMATVQQYEDEALLKTVLDQIDVKLLNRRNSLGSATVQDAVDQLTVAEVRQTLDRFGREIARLSDLQKALINTKVLIEKATRPESDKEIF